LNKLLPELKPLKGIFDAERGYASLSDVIYRINDPETHGPTLRCGIAISNIGKGDLHIILGDVIEINGKKFAPAKQRIFNDDDSFTDVDVGNFEMHIEPEHDQPHWHYEGLAKLELFDDKGTKVKEGDKDSYCVADTFKYSELLHSPPIAQFHAEACEEKTKVGISVGWADCYRKMSEGQFIDLREIKTGTYYLRFSIMETKLVHDTSEPASIKLQIDKEKEKIVPC
jgi:hypothetical protein